jgi:hypothetical protein
VQLQAVGRAGHSLQGRLHLLHVIVRLGVEGLRVEEWARAFSG